MNLWPFKNFEKLSTYTMSTRVTDEVAFWLLPFFLTEPPHGYEAKAKKQRPANIMWQTAVLHKNRKINCHCAPDEVQGLS